MAAYDLPDLPYDYGALEPHISGQIMELHHDKHHAAYVRNLNDALAQHGEAAGRPLHELLGDLGKVPEAIRTAVRNNGGGHANHTMFWQIMGGSGGEPSGELKSAVDRDLGGLQKLQGDFNAAGEKQFGSGWVFVTVDRAGKLGLTARPNQDTPLMDGQRVLMGNDVWEHAYYLKYQNRRADYLKAWWNVLDWNRIGERYAAARAGTLTI
jgi:superoxide dismutase, Fe-Mn family